MTAAAPHPLLADPGYARLKDHILEATGLAYYAERDEDLAYRIAGRLTPLSLYDCTSYLALLLDGGRGEAELDQLIRELTIGETYFFRHRELFDALRDVVLPDAIRRNEQSRRLRIWCAGCATGAEPYSVSILLRREFARRLVGWETTLVATDINRDFLARAREGQFDEWAFRSASEELKRTCFVPAGKSWRIAPEFKEGISFQYHNLVQHPFPSLLNNLCAFDVILCRNVLIYFNDKTVQRVLEQFRHTLVEGGWLLVGHAEPNVQLFRSFRTVNAAGAVLYQKSQEQTPRSLWSPPSVAGEPEFSPPPTDWQPQPFPALPEAVPLPAVVESGPAPAARPRNVGDLRALADHGDLDDAARCSAELLRQDPLDPVKHFYDALLNDQLGRHARARESLRRAIYLDRQFVLAHYYLGLVQQKEGEALPAARSFRNALALLVRLEDDQILADADGITVAGLRELAQMQLTILEGA
jgi:chemotaxis protein methyltransferase CheR